MIMFSIWKKQRKKDDEYIEDIVGKMRHSFCVFAAIKLQCFLLRCCTAC